MAQPLTHRLIRAALRRRLLSTPGLETMGQQWENRKFQTAAGQQLDAPREGLPWFRETYIPAGETKVADGTEMWTGSVTFGLFFPMGGGSEGPEDLAEAVKLRFPPGATLSGIVHVSAAQRRPAIPEPPLWYQLPVTVQWWTTGVPADDPGDPAP
jgi:hypothetical protein